MIPTVFTAKNDCPLEGIKTILTTNFNYLIYQREISEKVECSLNFLLSSSSVIRQELSVFVHFFWTRILGWVIFSTALSRRHIEVLKMTSIEHVQSARRSNIESSGARVKECHTSLIIFISATKYKRVFFLHM